MRVGHAAQARLDSEPVVSELRRGFEGLEPQCPARVSPLFGAVQAGLTAGRPAQVDEGRVGRVDGRYAERGQRRGAVGGARGGAGGGEGSGEGVEGGGRVRTVRGVGLEGEGVAVRGGERVAVGEGVGGRGLVAEDAAVRAVRAAAAGRVPAAG